MRMSLTSTLDLCDSLAAKKNTCNIFSVFINFVKGLREYSRWSSNEGRSNASYSIRRGAKWDVFGLCIAYCLTAKQSPKALQLLFDPPPRFDGNMYITYTSYHTSIVICGTWDDVWLIRHVHSVCPTFLVRNLRLIFFPSDKCFVLSLLTDVLSLPSLPICPTRIPHPVLLHKTIKNPCLSSIGVPR